jgi:hypothetical protein
MFCSYLFFPMWFSYVFSFDIRENYEEDTNQLITDDSSFKTDTQNTDRNIMYSDEEAVEFEDHSGYAFITTRLPIYCNISMVWNTYFIIGVVMMIILKVDRFRR